MPPCHGGDRQFEPGRARHYRLVCHFCGIICFMRKGFDLEKVANTIFSKKRFIGVTDVVLGFSMENYQFFTVADIDSAYRASRHMKTGQATTPVAIHLRDMVDLGMTDIQANIGGALHYGLLESPLWGVVGAYSVAMDEMFPEPNEVK
ncbi:MAG: hypothetical protein QG623_87 [Patescibacteria group bacterium]|nr:hypothetical protein [Patescibacteria group bacterium]